VVAAGSLAHGGVSSARRRWAANDGAVSPTTLVGTQFHLAPTSMCMAPHGLSSPNHVGMMGRQRLSHRVNIPHGERLLQAGSKLSPLGAVVRGTGGKFPREQRRTAGFLFHDATAMWSPRWRDSYSPASVARTNDCDINGPLRPPRWSSQTTPSLHSPHPCAGSGGTRAPEATSTTGSTSARMPRPPP
jgi:hypothetical protein